MLALTTALFFDLVAASVGNTLDPIATDPDKYKVILENETVRVLDYRDNRAPRRNSTTTVPSCFMSYLPLSAN